MTLLKRERTTFAKATAMFTQIRLKRYEPYGMSTLELEGPDSELQLKFVSRLGKRERRAVIRGFLIQIRPWLSLFTRGAIDHSNDGLIRSQRARSQGVRALASQPLNTLSGGVGYAVKVRRLELGLSQAELARRTGIQRSHLSALERGHHLPTLRIRSELERVLTCSLT